jgi:hypothetical protein
MVLAMVAPGGSKRSDEGATLTKGQAEARSPDKWMAARVDGLRARGPGDLSAIGILPRRNRNCHPVAAGPQRYLLLVDVQTELTPAKIVISSTLVPGNFLE